ncbi:MAG: cytochrome c-type biogenesis protein CcmH [Thermodesulfobacteriota bacterium]
MNWKKGNFPILFLLFGISVLWVSPALSVTVGEITQELTCTCGCNMVVSACEGAMECSAANGIKAQVMEKLSVGQSKEEIIGYFVNRYGEKILSAPTKRGFNLTAWILPFFAIVSGGGVLYFTLKKWYSMGAEHKEGRRALVPGKVEDKYLERFEEELKDFDY